MRFMVIVKADKDSEAGILPSAKLLADMGKFNEELAKAGVLLAAEGLQASSKGARMKFSGARRTVTDGPFTESKELIAGFWIWKVKSKEEAIEWLKRAPFDQTEVEIRQVFEPEDFGSEVAPESNNQKERMITRRLIPILNVSNIQESFIWFEKLGWKKGWDWGSPPTFGGVCSGEWEIFLCENGQGGRGRGNLPATFGIDGGEKADKGVWVSIMVENVDAVHRHCVQQGLEITWPPTDMPWNIREMHVRHPDGHVFRIGQGIEEEE